ncbi:helix-turn-helix transcriptional regulator [Gibbsiella quercinecans]|uniref:helix-turn-helix transcriptional regulator n=1 Tax=Gibbsiella quercinecans TaxID=929813 RepID=UPI000EF14ACC|nr:hypothetical protein [Gibbsiella quercinecans]RLM03101.1 hypothetical protein BIY31_22410 [Gibbsiella quercinecans]RLM05237.1 hypothetical protein BIY27_21210 [Gibbsiella quercinecans]
MEMAGYPFNHHFFDLGIKYLHELVKLRQDGVLYWDFSRKNFKSFLPKIILLYVSSGKKITLFCDDHTLPVALYLRGKSKNIFIVRIKAGEDVLLNDLRSVAKGEQPLIPEETQKNRLTWKEYHLLDEILRGKKIISISKENIESHKTTYSRVQSITKKMKVRKIAMLIMS